MLIEMMLLGGPARAAGPVFSRSGGGSYGGKHGGKHDGKHDDDCDDKDGGGKGGPDGIVEGSGKGDLIDAHYTGDPDGDRIDNGDAVGSGVGPDDDVVLAGGGNDTVFSGEGSDTVFGGDGNDRIDTATGLAGQRPDLGYPGLFPADPDPEDDRDFVDGGAGNDFIVTGDDRDTIIGGDGNDTIDAGLDQDEVTAGAGDDFIVSGEGSDTVLGGEGNDTIFGGLGPNPDLDRLNIPDDRDLVPDNGRDLLDGGAGDDVIYGQDDDDTLIGGDGNDTLDGGIDEDVLVGGRGDDVLVGGEGADTMLGGDDADTFLGADDGDLIDGGSGGDDFDTLILGGPGTFRIVNETPDRDGNGTDGTIEFLDGDGNVTGTAKFHDIERIVPCFTPGTLIATVDGERPVESLRVGDKVLTRDNGVQEIRWVGAKPMDWRAFAAAPHLRPVLIRRGALGNGLPERDMLVSPQHRVLVANERTALYFAEHEVLVSAKHLVGQDGIHAIESMGTTYIHFMCDRHEVVLSDGAWTETFQPGDLTLKGLGNAQRLELFELFPELDRASGGKGYGAARKTLKAHEARLLRA